MATRAEIEQAKREVEQAKSSLAESRRQITSARGQVSSELSKLYPAKRIPFTPRKERLLKVQYGQELGKATSELSLAEARIAEQERLISEYESGTLRSAETELKNIAEYNRAVDIVKKAAAKGMVWAHAYYGEGMVRQVAQEYLKAEKLQREQLKKSVLDYQKQNPTEKLLVDWKNLKITGVESGALGQSISLNEYNKKLEELNKQAGNYQMYEKSIPGYYDPFTGREVLQSIAPQLAKQRGLIPIEVQGYNTATGGYIIKSEKGLLTPAQQSYKQVIGKLRPNLKETETPTVFEIGGKDKGPKYNLPSLTGETTYEAASKSTPYLGKELSMIEFERLGPEGFYNKYGYYVTSSGEKLYPGGAAAVTAEDIMTLFGGARALSGIGKAGLSKAAVKAAESVGIFASKPIVEKTSQYVEMAPNLLGFSSESIPAQVLRGGLYAGTATIPGIGTAYATELLKETSRSPLETARNLAEYVKTRPYEVGTMAALGLLKLREYRLNRKAAEMIKENIKELNEIPTKEISFIWKGKGLKLNSDRLQITALQETKNGIRKIIVEGDLLTQRDGRVYFLPEATGRAVTISYSQPSRLSRLRIYQDAQRFKVGGKSTGILLGNIGDLQFFTPTGKSTYVPEYQRYAMVKKKFGPYADERTLIGIIRELEKDISYGGTVTKQITLPFEELGIKFDEQTTLLIGKRGTGLVFTSKEPIPRLGKKYGVGGKKTPFSETFQEQKKAIAQRTVNMEKLSKSVGEQSEMLVNSLVESKIKESLKGIPRMTGGTGAVLESGLSKRNDFVDFVIDYETVQYPKTRTTDYSRSSLTSMILPVSGERIKIQTKQKERQTSLERQETLQRQRLLERQRQLEKERQIERQKQLEKQRTLQKQMQLLKQKQLASVKSPYMGMDFGFDIGFGFEPPDKKGRIQTLKQKKKKKKDKRVLPTLTQELIGYKGKKPKDYITGLEAIRII